jgi:phosphoribosylanthranilate isomerase
VNTPPARIRVKICGITSSDDALAAIAHGADALGFNLYPGSKRCIDLTRESVWIHTLPPFVTRVAVLVNVPLDEARSVATQPAIDILQFHGDEDETYCARFAETGRPFIKAIRLRDPTDIAKASHFSTPHILLDSHSDAAYGGTGTRIDLSLASAAIRTHPHIRFILAGGLTPANVAEAIRATSPYAVDVASGVETPGAPRKKDPHLLHAFLAAVAKAAA